MIYFRPIESVRIFDKADKQEGYLREDCVSNISEQLTDREETVEETNLLNVDIIKSTLATG